MKVLYDFQTFQSQIYGGISRYFAELIDSLPLNVKYQIAICYSDNVYLHRKNLCSGLQPLQDVRSQFLRNAVLGEKESQMQKVYTNSHKYGNTSNANKICSIEALKNEDFDVFHPTYFDDYFLEHIGDKPFVLTIHDMIHELFPELLFDTFLPARKANLVQKASHIIAISENTKRDVVNILDVPENKVTVIYHGSSLWKGNRRSLDLPERYLLFVGERGMHKNFLFFARSMQAILMEVKDLYILCTGRKFMEAENSYLMKLGIRDRFIHRFIEEEDFFEVYHKAIAFIYPSYYEGFGIPILEAFEAGCPVVVSQASCFPEVAGNAALYFEPKNMKQLQDAILSLMNNIVLRQDLIEKGKLQAGLFSWQKTATETLKVYEQVLTDS